MKTSLLMKTSTASRIALAGLLATAFLTSGLQAASTWSGAGANAGWATASNFDVTPVSGNTLDIVFGTASYLQPISFLGGASYTVRSITFNANADSTSGISLNNGGTTARNLTFDTDAVGGNASLTVDSGSAGNITIGSGAGTVWGRCGDGVGDGHPR